MDHDPTSKHGDRVDAVDGDPGNSFWHFECDCGFSGRAVDSEDNCIDGGPRQHRETNSRDLGAECTPEAPEESRDAGLEVGEDPVAGHLPAELGNAQVPAT